MEIDFIQWLCDAYKEGSLEEEDIKKALANPYKAHDLFKEYVTNDIHSWGEEVQQDIKEFAKNYLPRLKAKPPTSEEPSTSSRP
jgi:hypothetical protein